MNKQEKLEKRAQVVALLKNVRFTTQAHTHLSVHIQIDEHDSQVVKIHEPYAFTRYLDGWELLPSRKCVALRDSLDWFYRYTQDHEGIERDLMRRFEELCEETYPGILTEVDPTWEPYVSEEDRLQQRIDALEAENAQLQQQVNELAMKYAIASNEVLRHELDKVRRERDTYEEDPLSAYAEFADVV